MIRLKKSEEKFSIKWKKERTKKDWRRSRWKRIEEEADEKGLKKIWM